MSRRIERNFKGHFICAKSCRWFKVTDVDGKWRVSSIGDMHSDARVRAIIRKFDDGPEEIGYQHTYETMVFPLGIEVCEVEGCEDRGSPLVSSWREVASGCYNSKAAAARGHERMVKRVLAGEFENVEPS